MSRQHRDPRAAQGPGNRPWFQALVWMTRGITRQPLCPPGQGPCQCTCSSRLSAAAWNHSHQRLLFFPCFSPVEVLENPPQSVGGYLCAVVETGWGQFSGQFLNKNLTFPPRMVLGADSQARWGEASWAAPSSARTPLLKTRLLPSPSPLPCQVPTLSPLSLPHGHQAMNH